MGHVSYEHKRKLRHVDGTAAGAKIMLRDTNHIDRAAPDSQVGTNIGDGNAGGNAESVGDTNDAGVGNADDAAEAPRRDAGRKIRTFVVVGKRKEIAA
jgi:hypothetical protein